MVCANISDISALVEQVNAVAVYLAWQLPICNSVDNLRPDDKA